LDTKFSRKIFFSSSSFDWIDQVASVASLEQGVTLPAEAPSDRCRKHAEAFCSRASSP
jgi:hypothetical protein